MIINPTIEQDLAKAITDVLNEVASELDYHYEDSDLVATASTLQKMKTLAEMLQQAGYPEPEVYSHIASRYRKSIN